MSAQVQIEAIASDAPYTLDNFLWLMEHSSAKSFLPAESLSEIEEALSNSDEDYLLSVYPLILDEFVKERDININFALQQESLMNDFISHVEEVDHQVKSDQKVRTDKIEAEEHSHAEDILDELNI